MPSITFLASTAAFNIFENKISNIKDLKKIDYDVKYLILRLNILPHLIRINL